jgi:hypothetical protein
MDKSNVITNFLLKLAENSELASKFENNPLQILDEEHIPSCFRDYLLSNDLEKIKDLVAKESDRFSIGAYTSIISYVASDNVLFVNR